VRAHAVCCSSLIDREESKYETLENDAFAMASHANTVEPQPGTSPDVGQYPDLRGSAAAVLAVPPADVSMSATAAAWSEARTAEDTVGKRQKKEEVNIKDVDLGALPDGFKDSTTAAVDGLTLTRDVRAVEALLVKHHQAAVVYKRQLLEQAATQSKLEARLKAMETAVPAPAKQHAAGASDLAKQATAAAVQASQRA
jgi:hypothetical protein